jgi:tetraacyldisaccharide 4'-kinase
MMLAAPEFWWRPKRPEAWLLSPAALAYGAVARARMKRGGVPAPLPVICIGNFVTGGAGKTPVAMAVAELMSAQDMRPAFLTRGYGGRLRGPVLVDPAMHTAADVGDEPLLLAGIGPTMVSANRPQGAKAVADAGTEADSIIMDDGFQNPSLYKDVSLVVVDAVRGIGNGWVLPAGPLRAPLRGQLRKADAIVLVGEGEAGAAMVRTAARAGVPVIRADYQPVRKRGFKRKPYLAFAGIAAPRKFYDTLEQAGANVEMTMEFPDHHPFTDDDCEAVIKLADDKGLTPITTAKDQVRLAGRDGPAGYLYEHAEVFPVAAVFREPRRLMQVIREGLDRRLVRR